MKMAESSQCFQKILLQTCKNKGLFGKGLTAIVPFETRVDQDRIAQNVQSDLSPTVSYLG